MTKSLKKQLIKIIIAALLFAGAFFPLPQIIELALLVAAYLIVGTPILLKAARNIRNGQIFDENFLMTIATFGAFALQEYTEAVAVMLFFQVGEFFQSYAVNKSRKSIAALMDIRPDYAHIKRGKELITVSPEEVKLGEIIIVQPGERIPLDGTIIKGNASLNTSALTGESLPRDVSKGENVLSGSVNLNGVIEIKTTSVFSDSTVSRILDLVENAGSKKAQIEAFITRFARYYTPTVVIIALALAFLPPLLGSTLGLKEWIYRAITFLVISCPCALVISIPLSFFAGMGAASRCGVLVKGGNYLEALSRAEIFVFDKTGTLTKGNFKVTNITAFIGSKETLLQNAAKVEAYSHHPIAASIKQAYDRKIDVKDISDVEEIAGCGIKAKINNQEISVGNKKILDKFGIAEPKIEKDGTILYVLYGNKLAGYIKIEDEIKTDSAQTISLLKAHGIKETVMLTGDRKEIGHKIGKKLGLDTVHAELLPIDKVSKIEQLLSKKSANGQLVFIGDGINDAPVLARSDIGIAMGGIGSDAAVEAADIVIMTDEPSKIISALKIAKKTIFIAKENIVFAIGVKLLVLALGALGYASIWAAVFADVGVSVIAILNAVRLLPYHPKI